MSRHPTSLQTGLPRGQTDLLPKCYLSLQGSSHWGPVWLPSPSVLLHVTTLTFQKSRLYAYLAKRPFLNLMQNITLDATTLLVSEFHLISYLKFFSNPAVPRSCCTVCLWMRCLTYPHPNTWSEGDLFDSVRKLTAFETVVLRYSHQLLPGGQSMMPKPKAIDEYLSVMLGPGEFNSFDGVSQHRVQCLTYHPRGMKEKKVSK